MDHTKYDHLLRHRVEVDHVRKASHERAACLALDARVRERGLDDTGKHHVDSRTSHGRRVALPPLAGGEQDGVSRSAEKLPTHLVPGNS